MSLYYQNVRGLRSKASNVYLKSQQLPFDVYVLTETNLNDTYNNNEFFTSDFSVFRKDSCLSSNHKSRGVLIAVHSKFDCSLFSIPNTDNLEIICVKISNKKKHIFILNCYLRPNSPIENYQLFANAVDFLNNSMEVSDDLLIFGDFNLPKLNWFPSDDETHFVASNVSTEKETLFTDNLANCGLLQISKVKNNLNRQLDLIFTTDVNNCLADVSIHTLSTIDPYHPPLSLTFSFENGNINVESENTYKFNFRRANFPKLNDLLSNVNFDFISDCTSDINVITTTFYAKVFDCVFQSVPFSRQKNISSAPPWYNSDLRALRNRKNRVWYKYLSSKSEADYFNYVCLYTEFSDLSNRLYSEFIHKMQFSLKLDPKRFWQFINIKKKSDGYPTSLKFLNQSSNDPKIISNLFANFFKSAFTDNNFEPDVNYFNNLNNSTQTFLTSITIDFETVREKISKLKDDYSSGPDGLPPIVLKKCIDSLAQPLTALFQKSISLGVFPSAWKGSFIIPVHKKSSKNEINNYRPIVKLSCIPKLFESNVYDTIYAFCKPLISPKQHGFLRGKSTTTNLTEFASHTIKILESGNEVDVITTDFSQAFDKLSHNLILFKLRALGFPTLIVNWFSSYLSDRRYQVQFRLALSEPFVATSGVPQGSHLGPLLFVLSINDVTSVINTSGILVYADDMKIYHTISSTLDSQVLQGDLERFTAWCSNNNLVLNVQKCQTITFSKKRCVSPMRNYFINCDLVPRVSIIRDLGVICDKELNFNSHIDNIVNRANSALGFTKRWSKEFSDPFVTRALFLAIVRPILEYASQVWSPYHEVHIKRIEAVQRRFVRFALRGLPWFDTYDLPPYHDRRKLIGLDSLTKRREVADVIFIHQVLSGAIECPSILQMINININHRSTRLIDMFRIDYHRTDYGRNEPITRMLRHVNKNMDIFDFHYDKSTLRKLLINDE